jgi:hypothetical protein
MAAALAASILPFFAAKPFATDPDPKFAATQLLLETIALPRLLDGFCISECATKARRTLAKGQYNRRTMHHIGRECVKWFWRMLGTKSNLLISASML